MIKAWLNDDMRMELKAGPTSIDDDFTFREDFILSADDLQKLWDAAFYEGEERAEHISQGGFSDEKWSLKDYLGTLGIELETSNE